MPLVLVGGGSRSGKSRHALALARAAGTRLAFIATAQAYDDEMRDRIARHREEREPGIVTIEEPFNVAGVIPGCRDYDAVIVDCLTLWLSNLMLSGHSDFGESVTDVIAAAAAAPNRVILVTNEVGCGIVPENELARRFRDAAGILNQRVAQAAVEVYWMIFGCALKIK